jgi:hypothetical protein
MHHRIPPAFKIAWGSDERKPCCDGLVSARNGAMLKAYGRACSSVKPNFAFGNGQ